MQKNGDNHQDNKLGGHTYRPSSRPPRPGEGGTPATPKPPPTQSEQGAKEKRYLSLEEQLMAQTGELPAQRPTAAKSYDAHACSNKKDGAVISIFGVDFTRLHVILGSGIVVLLLAVILVLLIPSCMSGAATAQSSSSVSHSASASHDSNYDKDANVLPTDEFEGTVLPETEPLSDAEMEEYLADTLFLGDSNTERMHAFRDETGLTRQNAIGVEGMHVSEFTTKSCVTFRGDYATYTMPQAVEMLQPLRVVITFGTNDAASYNVETFRENYKEAIEAIEEAYPYAEIIIGSVFPIEHNRSYSSVSMTRIDEFNVELLSLAEEMDAKFLNWSEALRDDNSGYAESGQMLSDGIHLNANGMQNIFDYFATHLLHNEDTRPMPLNDIPTVSGAVQPVRPVTSTPESSSSQVSSTSSSVPTSVPSSSVPQSVPAPSSTPAPASTPSSTSTPAPASTPSSTPAPPSSTPAPTSSSVPISTPDNVPSTPEVAPAADTVTASETT